MQSKLKNEIKTKSQEIERLNKEKSTTKNEIARSKTQTIKLELENKNLLDKNRLGTSDSNSNAATN